MKKGTTLEKARLEGGLKTLTWLRNQIEFKERELQEEIRLLSSEPALFPTASEIKDVLK